MPSDANFSQLRTILGILNKNVDILEESCKTNGTQIPDLKEPFHPDSEAFRRHEDAAEAANIIVAAAQHIAALLTPPQVSMYHEVSGVFRSAAVRVCLEGSVTEILREAGPQGLHVEVIARKTKLDSQKLSRLLRILATNHFYREVTPDVFANTRISSILDTGKPSEVILVDPEHKHDDTTGVPALMALNLDESFKAAAYIWEALSEPSKNPDGSIVSPFTRALGTGKTLYQYYRQPDQRFRAARFSIAMKGISAFRPPDNDVKAFDWASLPAGSLVVDIGGGIGNVTHSVARKFEGLKFVIQDRPGTIEDAKVWWAGQMPEAISSGRVALEGHDFFSPQPEHLQNTVSVFMIKQVLHNWSDDQCIKILKCLREAAKPDTVLLAIEYILPYACRDPNGAKGGIPGTVPREAPEPLLANYGLVGEMEYDSDINMLILFDAQARTAKQYENVFRSAGWKLRFINREVQALEAVPL
ncbi:S-adenosyl-L-methionine-dependent methyltransferase [Marasmius fiardii PR-910]|nr:S-adenosyl-L-methionine-dependent methyltransferase [Marasmius fiardii PR-910]